MSREPTAGDRVGHRRSAEAQRRLPHELPHDEPERRRFATADGEWLAWLAGRSVGGTGSYNLALLEAVHFARAEQPAQALREALVARGQFECVSDSELAQIWAIARSLTAQR
jgi:hypothetical protein